MKHSSTPRRILKKPLSPHSEFHELWQHNTISVTHSPTRFYLLCHSPIFDTSIDAESDNLHTVPTEGFRSRRHLVHTGFICEEILVHVERHCDRTVLKQLLFHIGGRDQSGCLRLVQTFSFTCELLAEVTGWGV